MAVCTNLHEYCNLEYLIVMCLMMSQGISNKRWTLNQNKASVSSNFHLSTQDTDYKIMYPVVYNTKKCVASWGFIWAPKMFSFFASFQLMYEL